MSNTDRESEKIEFESESLIDENRVLIVECSVLRRQEMAYLEKISDLTKQNIELREIVNFLHLEIKALKERCADFKGKLNGYVDDRG